MKVAAMWDVYGMLSRPLVEIYQLLRGIRSLRIRVNTWWWKFWFPLQYLYVSASRLQVIMAVTVED